jgi:hypothetical protein
MALTADIVLKAGGMEPIPLLGSLGVGISMCPSGKVVPTLLDGPNRQPDAIIVAYDRFVAIAKGLKTSY